MPLPTTSGTYSFNTTRDYMIRMALRKLGAIGQGETPTAPETSEASDAMNVMIKEWEGSGIHVFAEYAGACFLQPGQTQYTLGANGTDPTAFNFTNQQTTATAIGGATAVQVPSIAGIVAGSNFGVTLDAGNIFWTTVNGAPSGTTVNLAGALPSQATLGAWAYNYGTPIVRPLRIYLATRYNVPSQIDTPLTPFSILDYAAMPNKQTLGTVTQFLYVPTIGLEAGVTNALGPGTLNVWPAPQSPIQDAIKFTYQGPLQDVTNASQVTGFPQEWQNAIIWNLAVELAPEYDVDPQRLAIVAAMANKKLEAVQGWDREPQPVMFGVAFEPWYR